MPNIPTIKAIKEAAQRIRPYIHRTPVFTSRSIDALCGASLFFKCENLQRGGSFKIRGAANAVLKLDDQAAKRGVATHSSGNFAQALTLAAGISGVPVYVVMPRTSPEVKREAVLAYGGKITFCEPTLAAREEGLAAVVAQTAATFIHPYNDADVVAGQGTAALELIEEVSGLDVIIAPVGGGGLVSGTALATKNLSPKTTVYAAEPAGADDAYRSLQAGRIIPSEKPDTIADGLLTSLGDLTFAIIRKHVAAIITVTDAEIISAMRLIWERMKLIVEPSGAVVLAAVLKERKKFTGKRVGLILSGGNVDLERLPW